MTFNPSVIKTMLTECMAAGVPFRKAAIIAAVSANETGNCFGVDRTTALVYPQSCYPRRQILRLEKGRSASNPLSKGWTSDQTLMSRLQSMGYVTNDGSGKWYVTANSGVTAVDTCKEPNNAVAYLFEYLIDQRKLAALQAFSIGPTQQYLLYSPATLAAPGIASRFRTIDDLWAFYTATSITKLVSREWFDYLPTTRADYPTAANASSGAHRTYLTAVQTGSAFDWSTSAGRDYLAGFTAAVLGTWDIAREISYPGAG